MIIGSNADEGGSILVSLANATVAEWDEFIDGYFPYLADEIKVESLRSLIHISFR